MRNESLVALTTFLYLNNSALSNGLADHGRKRLSVQVIFDACGISPPLSSPISALIGASRKQAGIRTRTQPL
jgi:hypothetical protein